jgi:hypothetical protein
MKTAVRYYSKLGNTKTIAEAIAEGAGVEAVSITEEPEPLLPVCDGAALPGLFLLREINLSGVPGFTVSAAVPGLYPART